MPKRTDTERKKIFEEINSKIKSSELTIKEICALYNITDTTFYNWRRRFECNKKPGEDEPTETEKLIIRMKKEHPYYGQKKIVKQLERFHGIKVKRSAVASILKEHGLKKTSGHKQRKKGKRRFERIEPMDMVQMDLMYYTLKKNRRFYLISVLDDYSRYILSHKITTSQTKDKVIDTLKSAVEKHGAPRQVLTDRGSQFHAWKGMSQFDKLLSKMNIEHVLTSPQSPQTIGKIESWHRNIQRELFSQKEFGSVEAVRDAVADYVEYYNHERVHMGIDYSTPADRFFGVDDDMQKILDTEQKDFYLTARIDGEPLRATKTGDNQAQVKLAGKELKEVEISDIKKLLF